MSWSICWYWVSVTVPPAVVDSWKTMLAASPAPASVALVEPIIVLASIW